MHCREVEVQCQGHEKKQGFWPGQEEVGPRSGGQSRTHPPEQRWIRAEGKEEEAGPRPAGPTGRAPAFPPR